MMHKNNFFILVLCIFMSNLSASDGAPEEVSSEVVSELEMEQLELEQLLKAMDSEEFIEGVIRGMKEGMKKAFEEFGAETAKKWADKKKEEAKITKEALIKSSEKSDSEASNRWEPVIIALISLYAAKNNSFNP